MIDIGLVRLAVAGSLAAVALVRGAAPGLAGAPVVLMGDLNSFEARRPTDRSSFRRA